MVVKKTLKEYSRAYFSKVTSGCQQQCTHLLAPLKMVLEVLCVFVGGHMCLWKNVWAFSLAPCLYVISHIPAPVYKAKAFHSDHTCRRYSLACLSGTWPISSFVIKLLVGKQPWHNICWSISYQCQSQFTHTTPHSQNVILTNGFFLAMIFGWCGGSVVDSLVSDPI